MAFANQIANESGTQFLNALLVTCTVYFSFLAARHHLKSQLAALLVAIGCNVLLLSLPNRPHQFTHLGLAVVSYLLTAYLASGRVKYLSVLPAVLVLWVNLHGGYSFGLIYLWLFSISLLVERYITGSRQVAPLAPLFLLTFLSTLSTLLNPYGIGAWLYVIDIGSLKSASSGLVDEWGPTAITSDIGLTYFLVVTILWAAMATSSSRPRIYQVLLALMLTVLGWSALRISLMTMILMTPLVAAFFKDSPLYSLMFDGKTKIKLESFSISTSALLLMTVAALGLTVNDKASVALILEKKLPVQEIAFIKQNGISGRILNSPEPGGYLIRTLGQPVFMDTRFDLYGDKLLYEYIYARRGTEGWKAFIEHHDPDYLLIDNESALRTLSIISNLYRLVYEGPSYSVLVKSNTYLFLPTAIASDSTQHIIASLKR